MTLHVMRVCLKPGCPTLVRSPKSRCREHDRDYEALRGTPTQRGYDATWRRFSKAWLRRHPLCGERADSQLHAEHSRCAAEGRTVAARATDHILSMANGGAKFDEANLQSLCSTCNAVKRNMVDGVNARSSL